jgi:hypothetical protein
MSRADAVLKAELINPFGPVNRGRSVVEKFIQKTLSAAIVALGILAAVSVADATDFSTLNSKHIVGYQGWFGCPSDPIDPRWVHWFRGGAANLGALTVDLWPDLSDFDKSELCPTGMTLPTGAPAFVFSSENAATVRRHFRWMKQYEIDGAAVQRFVSEVQHSPSVDRATLVLRNVRAAAEVEKRGFFIMYDVSGVDGDRAIATIEQDWRRLVAERLPMNPSYMGHLGKPVVGVWGLGFKDRNMSATQAEKLIRFFKSEARVSLLGGVPAHWRSLDGDSRPEEEWSQVYRSFDILTPWTVGRFRDPHEADAFARNVMAVDIQQTRARGQDYMPVIFPGFSWRNLTQGEKPLDQISRRCGSFYEEQANNALRLGATMLYSAMFDELDEGTALMKIARSAEELPAGAQLLTPDPQGCSQASDLYLQFARDVSVRLHGTSTP